MTSHFDPAERRDASGRWTKDATRKWLASNPVSHKNIIAMYDQATPGEKATGESWYPNAHKIAVAMAKSHGVTPRQAAGVIAAYSPQTPWGKNLMEANEVLRTHKALGGKGAHLDIVKTPNDTNEVRYGVMASGVNHKRAQALLSGADFENVFGGHRNKNGSLPPHSLKIRSFAELIANGGQTDPRRTKVVIDRHAASVARGVRMTEEDYAVDGPSSSKVKYKAYADAYRQAAEELSKREGRTITPEALQATTWLTRQRLNNTEAPNGRKALGNRDESESLNYFASYEPNIADVIGHPMTGYAELSKVRLKDTDLAVAHVRTPAGVRKYHEPIGSPITGHPDLPGASHSVKSWPANPKAVKINGMNMALDKAVKIVGDAYEWPDMDREGGPSNGPSIHEQHRAQVIGKVWYENHDTKATSLWEQYQSPQVYGLINATLRTGKHEPGDPTQKEIQGFAEQMFKEGGYTTQRPMTVFRALKSKRASSFEPGDDTGTEDWAAKLKPGTTFTDKGIVSTTAHERFSQGWLMGDAQGADTGRENPNDVVLEIHCPTGTRIVGGDPQFIETMLAPGSTFKVVSSETRKADAVNPLDHKTASFNYTHVIAELQP